MNVYVRVVLVEFHQHRVDQLLQNGVVLGKTDSGGVNAGHGQQIFHHPHQPLGVGADVRQKLHVGLPGKGIEIVPHGGTCAVNGGQGRAQVVGHRPKEIAPHPLLFRLGLHLLLPLDLGCHGAGHDGHHQHHHRRGQTLRADQVERPVGIGEGVIHGHDAGQRGNDPPEIPLRPPCDQEHAQHEDHGRHGRDTEPLEQRQIQGKCRHQNDRRVSEVQKNALVLLHHAHLFYLL